MLDENDAFTVLNNGVEEKVYELAHFTDEISDKTYIIYTDNTKDENDNLNVYASILLIDGDKKMIKPLENDYDKDIVERFMLDLKSKM